MEVTSGRGSSRSERRAKVGREKAVVVLADPNFVSRQRGWMLIPRDSFALRISPRASLYFGPGSLFVSDDKPSRRVRYPESSDDDGPEQEEVD